MYLPFLSFVLEARLSLPSESEIAASESLLLSETPNFPLLLLLLEDLPMLIFSFLNVGSALVYTPIE